MAAIDSRLIRELARLLEETGLSEIEIEQGGRRVKVARQIAATGAAPPPERAAPKLAPEPAAQAPSPDPTKHPGSVTSPMVGTAFLAPEPGAAPFVAVGSSVSKGQTLLIIDAMKTMNPIAAPRAGKVKAIMIENGAPVEYGQPLMIVE